MEHTVSLNTQKAKGIDLALEWYWKLGHIKPDRYLKLSESNDQIPQFGQSILHQLFCVPCITAKTRRAKISRSTRKTTRPLELLNLDISGKVEESYEGYKYTVSFLDGYTAKSDITLVRQKSKLYKSFVAYEISSEVELQENDCKLTNMRMDNAGEK